VVTPEDQAEEAMRVARAYDSDWVVVVDDGERLLGWVSLHELEGTVGESPLHAFALQVKATDSLRAALNAMVTSRTGVAVRIDGDGRYEGMLTQDLISKEIL
jgi:osmoprotectant transport system ATP-binding protein